MIGDAAGLGGDKHAIEEGLVDAVGMLDQQWLGHASLPIVVLDKRAERAPIQDP